MVRSVPVNLVETLVPLLATQHETLHGFHTLQENLGIQGANELLNNVFNIIRQKNSNAIEERIQNLKESLQNGPSRENTIQEVISRKTRVAIPEPFGMNGNEAP